MAHAFIRLVALALVLAITGSATAAEVPIVVGKGTIPAGAFDEAARLAKDNDALLAIYYIPSSIPIALPNCPRCRAASAAKANAVASMTNTSASESVIHVALRTNEKVPESLTKAKLNLSEIGVYFVDGDLRLLGKASVDATADIKRVTAAVGQVADWRRDARRRIETAVREGSKGRVAAALKSLQAVAAEDAAIAKMVKDDWKTLGATPEYDPKAPAFFFPDVVAKSTETITNACKKDLAFARKLADAGKTANAIGVLNTLAHDQADVQVVKDAKALVERLKKSDTAPAPPASTKK